jgi:hypothetical protein
MLAGGTTGGATVKVWLDDMRPAPEGWIHVRWPEEAIALLEAGAVVELSLDHDLGDADERRTGYDVLVWIEERVALQGFEPPAIAIHSANASARERMVLAVESIARLAQRSPRKADPASRRDG